MKLLKLVSILTLALSATACVTGTREISLEVPTAEIQATKNGVIYIASIEDKRVFEQKPRIPEIPSVKGKLEKKSNAELNSYIGRQRNGYGAAMGSVALKDGSTVQDEVRKVLAASLKARGYTLSDSADNARSLDVDIQKFWAWMVPSFISVGFESEVELKLESQEKSSVVLGKGNNEGQVASNANWSLTYKRAYTDMLKNIEAALEKLDL